MALARFVKPFYSPISAGSMAHTGPVPQANVSYHVISPSPGQGIRVQPRSPFMGVVRSPQGSYPSPLQPVNIPRPVGGPAKPLLPTNFVAPHNT